MNRLDIVANNIAHDELLEITQSCLSALISSDPLLSDLPADIVLDEIVAQTAVEHGQSITVYIARESEPTLQVIVPQNATVMGLKKAIARHFELYQKRTQSKVKISWKYIWKTYDLNFDGLILDEDSSSIENYNIKNKVTLTFKKRKRKKNKMKF